MRETFQGMFADQVTLEVPVIWNALNHVETNEFVSLPT